MHNDTKDERVRFAVHLLVTGKTPEIIYVGMIVFGLRNIMHANSARLQLEATVSSKNLGMSSSPAKHTTVLARMERVSKECFWNYKRIF